jgi:hypothetical protein
MLEQLAQAHQVVVMQILQRAKLVLEADERVGRQPAQRLERHRRVALAVDDFVDHAHAAGADAAHDLEARRAGEGRLLIVGRVFHRQPGAPDGRSDLGARARMILLRVIATPW